MPNYFNEPIKVKERKKGKLHTHTHTPVVSITSHSVLGSVAQSCPTLCNPMDCSPPGSLSTGILRQEYWGGLPCPSPGGLPNQGTEPRSLTLQADSLPSEAPGKLSSHLVPL